MENENLQPQGGGFIEELVDSCGMYDPDNRWGFEAVLEWLTLSPAIASRSMRVPPGPLELNAGRVSAASDRISCRGSESQQAPALPRKKSLPAPAFMKAMGFAKTARKMGKPRLPDGSSAALFVGAMTAAAVARATASL